MTVRTILLGGAAAMVLGASAEAAPNGWYASLEGGASWVQDVNSVHTRNAGLSTWHNTSSFDTGWAVLATVGYEWTQWRFEGEVGYRRNKMDRIASTGGSVTTDVGDFNELTLMANMLYDIPLGSRFSASVGGGVGLDRSRFRWAGFGVPGGIDETDWNFAWQAIAGLNYAIDSSWDLFVDYRYLNVSGPTYTIPNNRFDFEDLDKHAVTAGLRWRFSS